MASKRQKLTSLPRRPLPDLPQDLIISEILTRLPVKPLLRFQCVSKTWLSLISSPAFVKSHLHFQENDENKLITFSLANDSLHLSLFSIVHNKKPLTTSLYPDRLVQVPEEAFRLLGSHNGLLCFRGYDQKLIVWNPCTGKMKKVDDAPTSQCFDICGFGYDQQNSDYKVVYACRTENFMDNDLWIYSFKAGGWENIGRGFRAGIVNPNIGVHVSGTLNWSSNTMRACDGWKWKIISFNLTTNSATTLLLPKHERSSAIYISQSRGFLLASCLYKGEMSVWQMNEFGVEKSWTKLASISNLPKPPRRKGMLSDTFVIISSCVSLLYVSKNANVILKVAEYLKVYRSKTKRSSRKINVSRPAHGGFKAISFLETLVSPPGLSDDEDGEQEQQQS